VLRKRLILLAGAVALVAAACAGASDSEPEEANTAVAAAEQTPSTTTAEAGTPETTSSTSLAPAQGVLPDGPSALTNMTDDAFPDPLIPIGEIISGGPPPDGIPPIDAPQFLNVAENLDLLDPAEAVVALEIDGDARAYPIRAMVWHEIVNDTVGGVPISVTYCPLCNSAVSYVREIRGVETTFGTSGRLFASALVMYDRATESLWTHFDGTAVVGLLTGEQLEAVASPLMSWGDFRSAYPTGQVLDWTQTGFQRAYGSNPYTGYDNPDTAPFLFRGPLDDRARAKQRVVGVEIGDDAAAYSLDAIRGDDSGAATNTTVGDIPIAIFWVSGQASALDSTSIEEGADVGTVGVFLATIADQTLTFVADGDEFVDTETGSRWTITGESIEGPLQGERLERLPHLDTFWFAWSTYKPGTSLFEQ
jgi:hypothetical protein